MKIIVTEKPSVAQQFCHALNVTQLKDGYITDGEYYITWCFGHLVELSYPEAYDPSLKKWSMETLPFLPKNYKYNVINDSGIKKQFKTIKELYNRSDLDCIYYAGDPAREGIYIQFLVRQMAGHKNGIAEKVVWINSQTEEEIKRGIKEARPLTEYFNLASSGYLRAIEDYSTGINLSRALTLKYSDLINSYIGGKRRAISVGRVMCCVLGMVCDKEHEVKSAVEVPYYKVIASNNNAEFEFKPKETDPEYSLFYIDGNNKRYNGFSDKRDADAFIKTIPLDGFVVSSIKRQEKKKYAPLLYNLAELQGECSRKLKLSPDDTLKNVQSLYEKKLTTYPRTDARVLSTAITKVITENLTGIASFSSVAKKILDNGLYKGLEKTKYVDDSKIEDHYAIIPTGISEGIGNLNPTEREVYKMILSRFLAIFLPAEIIDNIQVEISQNGKIFSIGKDNVKYPGFAFLYGVTVTNNETFNYLCNLKLNSSIDIYELSVTEAKGSMPKRYSTGSLILAMENAGKLIEDDELRERIKNQGIGTSATRSAILKKLQSIGYIEVDKRQIVKPTNLGEMIDATTKITLPSFRNPKMTAEWEKALDKVVDGSITYTTFRQMIDKTIVIEIQKIKEGNKSSELKTLIEPYKTGDPIENTITTTSYKCPICGGSIIKYGIKGYGCANYKEKGCNFYVGKFGGKKIPDSECINIITKRKSGKIKGFTSKAGKKFDAGLIFDSETKSLKYDFGDNEPPKTSDYVCPKCKKKLIAYGNLIKCDCGFSMYTTFCSKTFTKTQVNELLEMGKTSRKVSSLKSAKGKIFDSYVVRDTVGKLSFDFS